MVPAKQAADWRTVVGRIGIPVLLRGRQNGLGRSGVAFDATPDELTLLVVHHIVQVQKCVGPVRTRQIPVAGCRVAIGCAGMGSLKLCYAEGTDFFLLSVSGQEHVFCSSAQLARCCQSCL